jgi:hypothetical protein
MVFAMTTAPRHPATHVPAADTAPLPTSRRPRLSTPVLVALDHEWNVLRRQRRVLRRVADWPTLTPESETLAAVTRSIRDLDDLVRATDRVCHDADAVLAALVTIARSDEVAARVVLQRILPAVISRSASWRRRVGNEAAMDILIGAAGLAIAAFDPVRRPHHIAPALVSDVIWIAYQRAQRRRRLDVELVPSWKLADWSAAAVTRDPIVALAEVVAEAERAGVAARHLATIRDLARAGSPSRAASDHAVTPRTIRNRRDAAAADIRDALGPAWRDWRTPLVA